MRDSLAIIGGADTVNVGSTVLIRSEETECSDGKTGDCKRTPWINPGLPETISPQDEKSQVREENSLRPAFDVQDVEESGSASESLKTKKLNFSMFDTDTEEEDRVFNSALDAIEDLTSVPEDSAPDENSSQEWSQEHKTPTTSSAEINIAQNQDKASQEAPVLRSETHSGRTQSKKRPLPLTVDSSSKFYHKEKRPRSRMENLKFAINNDHLRSTNSRKYGEDGDDRKSGVIKAISDSTHSGGNVKDKEIVIPETDDEQLKGVQLETFGLDQEDIDFWKEQGAAKKASISKLVENNKVAATPFPESSMTLQSKRLQVPKKKVQFSDEDMAQDNTSKKGKSLRSNSQPSRRKKLQESQDSQSSDDFILSSQQDQDWNSEDEFKPKRSRRHAAKKGFKK